MTTRALRYQDHATGRPPGRPGRSREEKGRYFAEVAREWLAHPGIGEPTLHRMRPDLPLREVREGLREVKKLGRASDRLRAELQRTTVVVLYAGVIGADDETKVGTDPDGAEVKAKAVRDPATRKILDAAVGGPATEEDVIAGLERVGEVEGWQPLVHATDGASPFTGETVSAYRRERRIVHLCNVPGTPTDNPHAERTMGEVKRASGLKKTRVVVGGRQEAAERVKKAVHDLNEVRPRRVLGWRTPSAVDAVLPPAYTVVSRERFYEAACKAREWAVKGLEDPIAIRKAEREAVWQTLQHFRLVIRRKGGHEIPTWNAEVFS